MACFYPTRDRVRVRARRNQSGDYFHQMLQVVGDGNRGDRADHLSPTLLGNGTCAKACHGHGKEASDIRMRSISVLPTVGKCYKLLNNMKHISEV